MLILSDKDFTTTIKTTEKKRNPGKKIEIWKNIQMGISDIKNEILDESNSKNEVAEELICQP
jgi:hypothetical protein